MIGKTAQIDLLTRVLDMANLRHTVISQNLANVNTPNYRRLDVTFDGELDRELSGGDALRLRIVDSPGPSERQDGNSVNVNGEIALLGQNTLLSGAASQLLALKLGQLRSAITGR